MAILKLYTYPDKVLSQKCEPVAEVTDEIRRFLDDMLETMYADKGVGLAAPQVGVTKRIIVIDDQSIRRRYSRTQPAFSRQSGNYP